MSQIPFQNPDVLGIERFNADIFVVTGNVIKFKTENIKYTYSAIVDPIIYQGNIHILEDAVRNKKKLWLIIELRATQPSAYSSWSINGKTRYLSDAHYVNESDNVDDMNPSKR
jgi:hypothetical protein